MPYEVSYSVRLMLLEQTLGDSSKDSERPDQFDIKEIEAKLFY